VAPVLMSLKSPSGSIAAVNHALRRIDRTRDDFDRCTTTIFVGRMVSAPIGNRSRRIFLAATDQADYNPPQCYQLYQPAAHSLGLSGTSASSLILFHFQAFRRRGTSSSIATSVPVVNSTLRNCTFGARQTNRSSFQIEHDCGEVLSQKRNRHSSPGRLVPFRLD